MIQAPEIVVDQRARVIEKFYALYELFTEEDGFLNALGLREDFDYKDVDGNVTHTMQYSLHETGYRLGQKRSILFGYSDGDTMKYNLDSGVFTSTPDLSASEGLVISVLLTDLDATQEVSLSTNAESTTTVYTPVSTGGTIANTFSNYVGSFYLVRNKDTGQIVDFDDDPAPYLNLPFLPANVTNGLPHGPDPADPTRAEDVRYDFKLNDENLAKMDRFQAKQTLKVFLNTVSPENSFIIGETVVIGTDSAIIYEISDANTDVMTSTILIDDISEMTSFAGQVANVELSQPAIITTGKEIRGLTSTAKGLLSATVPSYRWSLAANSIEFDETVDGVDDQDYFLKNYATQNVVYFSSADVTYPARIYLNYNLQAGIANQVSGDTEAPRVTPMANVTNPTLLQTFGLKRWYDQSPLDDNGFSDGTVPPHTTALLAISSARGLQINYQWYNGTSFLTLDEEAVTKMDQATWEGYLGYLSDENVSLIASSNPDIMSTSEPTDLNDSHNGTEQFGVSNEAGVERTGECFPSVELNPHYPSIATEVAYGTGAGYEDQMPFANTSVKYNLLDNTKIDYIIYAHKRWTYDTNPMKDISHGDVPGGTTYIVGPTGSRIDGAFTRLKTGKLSDGSTPSWNTNWTVPASQNLLPPADNVYGPMVTTGGALGSDSPFAGPGASSSTAGYVGNGITGQVVADTSMVVGNWYTKSTAGRVAPSGFTLGSPPYDGEHIILVQAHQTFTVNDFYDDGTGTMVAGDNLRYFTLTVNTSYYDHNVNNMRKLYKTELSGMSVSAFHGYSDTNDFQLVINALAMLESGGGAWSEDHLAFEDQFNYDYDYNAVSGTYPLERTGSLKTTDAVFNTFAKEKAEIFRAVNTYNEDYWTSFGLKITTQEWSPPAESQMLNGDGTANTDMLTAQFEDWRDKVNDYCLEIKSRIGEPHIYDIDGKPTLGAKSYSGMLYAAVATMLSGSTGQVKGIKNAINNIQSIYDDIKKKRKIYTTYGPVDTIT